jgi:hypothetical protein
LASDLGRSRIRKRVLCRDAEGGESIIVGMCPAALAAMRCIAGAGLFDDLAGIGKDSRFVLRVDQAASDADVEHAVTAFDELCVDVERFV